MRIAIVLLLTFVLTLRANAATIHVPQDQPTIQAGIDAAINGDTVLVGPGVYMGTGNVDITFAGKLLYVIGSENTIIDCQGTDFDMRRAFIFNSSEGPSSVLDGFEIINGYASLGGAVYCWAASPTLRNLTIRNCKATDGGGIYLAYSAASLEMDSLIGCSAQRGGAVFVGGYSAGECSISSCYIDSCQSASEGGGISIHDVIGCTLFRNVFTRITGYFGGAVRVASADSVRIINNTFYGNFADRFGGSVDLENAQFSTIKNNIMSNSGGGYAVSYRFCGGSIENFNCLNDNLPSHFNNHTPDPTDLQLTPEFIDEELRDLRLKGSSPCINAGDPNQIYNDPDGTRNDIGAFSFHQQDSILFVPEDFPTIQSAIDALTTARTISVGSGTYIENLDSRGKWFNLIGRGGADSTIVVPSDSSVCLLDYRYTFDTWDFPPSSDTLFIRGIEFRGCRNDTTVKIGGPDWGYPTGVLFDGCRFIENGVDSGSIVISAAGHYRTSIVGCTFERNFGGCIADLNDYSDFFLDNSIFIQNTGSPLVRSNDQYVEIDSNVFSMNNGTVLELDCQESQVRFNRFHKNVASTIYDGNTDYLADRVFSSNVLDSNVTTQDIIHLWLEMHGEWIRCNNNVIVDNEIGGAIFLQPGEGLQFEGNLVRNNHFGNSSGIIAGWIDCLRYYVNKNIIVENYNTIGLALIDGTFPSCYFYVHTNDSWNNELGNFGGDVDSTLNISADPLFCDAASGNFTLAAQSPAVGMGPYGVGCVALPELELVTIEEQQYLHVTTSQPKIIWHSTDMLGYPQSSFEIAVSTDNDWQFAEMWNPATFASPDSFVVYNGAPLIDGQTYYLRLRVSNSLGWSNWYELMFRMNSLPSIPLQHSPATGSIVSSLQPLFVVRNSSDSENDSLFYEFQLSSDSSMAAFHVFSVPESLDSLTSATVDTALIEDAKYFWRVRAGDYYEYSAWSPVISFWANAANSAPAQFDLTSPTNTYTPPIATRLPLFSWSSSNDIDPLDVVSYSLHVASDSTFNDQYILAGIAGNQVSLPDSLVWGSQYWWKVLAEDLNGGETWSTSTFRFRTMKIGDNDANGVINITDIVYIINFLFADGPAPVPPQAGNANCDDRFNITDAVFLINFIFADGPPPCEAGR